MPKGLRNNLVPIVLITVVVIYIFASFGTRSFSSRASAPNISVNTLVNDIKQDRVSKVNEAATATSLIVTLKDSKQYIVLKNPRELTVELLKNYGVTESQLAGFEYQQDPEPAFSQWASLLFTALPFLFIAGLLFMGMRRAQSGADQAFSFGRSRAKRLTSETPVVTFADVAGCDEAKHELVEVVEFLKQPEKFIQLGARIPKGVLLVGPPGTGKTLLAKACAGEAGVPFFSLSGSEFVELFVGVGASRVRDLFDQAKKTAPCIVFIDEIDAVGRQRGAGMGGGNDEREQTLNQMLVEMDGFGTDTNVIVVAATNRADTLDPALLRPGRFDRRVIVDAPDVVGREAILKVHTKGKPIAAGADLNVIARQTPGFTGADIENLVNESAILTARAGEKEITQKHLQEAIEKVALGPERKSRLISPRQKQLVAYHEAGHAVAAVLTPEAEFSVQKVTIIPRGMAGGVTWFAPDTEDNLVNYTKKRIEARMIITLAGRAAEEIVFDDISAGAVGDIEQATTQARAMVRQYGMSDALGPVNYGGRDAMVFLGRELSEGKNYSEKIAEQIDVEVTKIIRKAYERSIDLLRTNKDKLIATANALLEHETLDASEFKQMLGLIVAPPAELALPQPA